MHAERPHHLKIITDLRMGRSPKRLTKNDARSTISSRICTRRSAVSDRNYARVHAIVASRMVEFRRHLRLLRWWR